MKKLLLGLSLLISSNLALALTIAEYIEANGPLKIEKGVLNLSNKGITSLEGIELLANPETVLRLDLSNNLIENVSAADLQRFVNLVALDLSSNKLSSFPSIKMESLVKLKLKHNQIPALNGLYLPKLKKFKVGGNPLKTIKNFYAPAIKKFKIEKAPRAPKTVRSLAVGSRERIVVE